MHFVTFHTPSPLSDLQRALDELARSGFDLSGLVVKASARDPDTMAYVRIDFAGSSTVSPDSYVRRLGRMPEIVNLLAGAIQIMPCRDLSERSPR
ncbi:hypothetical protein [Pseudotabrizicola sp. 4114]|uniref:hypothetical protein n=1 Tax=Pseudotabrizicola sp. 4114 TaxID=2817731 RepID=UPI0028610C16|nr:hypothetical protein [Pseudorhodobacter sp. 4114]